eukprot:g15381.t1
MKGAKWMAANLPDSPTKLEGFKELKKGDQKKLLQLWKALASPEGKPSSKRKAEMEGKVAKKPASKISAITSVQGVLTSAQRSWSRAWRKGECWELYPAVPSANMARSTGAVLEAGLAARATTTEI